MIAPGEILFSRDSEDSRVFIIREGEVDIFIDKKPDQNSKAVNKFHVNKKKYKKNYLFLFFKMYTFFY